MAAYYAFVIGAVYIYLINPKIYIQKQKREWKKTQEIKIKKKKKLREKTRLGPSNKLLLPSKFFLITHGEPRRAHQGGNNQSNHKGNHSTGSVSL